MRKGRRKRKRVELHVCEAPIFVLQVGIGIGIEYLRKVK
jgi:hypothetical protein